jgi:hypothetical protein
VTLIQGYVLKCRCDTFKQSCHSTVLILDGLSFPAVDCLAYLDQAKVLHVFLEAFNTSLLQVIPDVMAQWAGDAEAEGSLDFQFWRCLREQFLGPHRHWALLGAIFRFKPVHGNFLHFTRECIMMLSYTNYYRQILSNPYFSNT